MDNSERDIEDLFNDRFKEDEAPVSNRVWDNIKQNLPKNLPSTNPLKNLIKKMLFTTLSVSIVSGIAFLYVEKTTNQTNERNTKLETQNAEQKTVNIEQETGNTEQEIGNIETEKDIKDKIKNNSIASSIFNKRTLLKKKKYSDNYNSFVSKKNKNIIAGNKNAIVLKADNRNEKTETASTLPNDYNDNSNTKIVSKNKKASVLNNNTSNKNTKNKYLIAQNQEKTKTTPQEEMTTNIIQKNTIKAKKQKTTHYSGNDISGKTELTEEHLLDKNSNSTKETDISTTKFDNKIDFNSSSNENKKKNKPDTIEQFVVKNNLNKAAINNSTVLPNEFSDSVNSSRKKNETPILSKADSNNKFTAINENRNKNLDSTLLASTSLVSEKDSIEPDSVHQLLLADSLVSENKKEKEKKDQHILSKFSFDLLAGPGITGVSVAPNLTDSISQSRVAHKKNNSASKVTVSGGIRVNYSLSERLSISVGIFYSNYSQTYTLPSHTETYSTTVPDSSIVGSKQDTIGSDTSGHPILGSPHPIYNHFKTIKNINTEYPAKTVTDHYTFISLPLTASYALINKKVGVVCLGGITTNILIKGVSHYINESFNDLVSNNAFTSVNMGVTGGVGLSYRFTKHLSFLIEPRVNYFLSNIEKSNSFIKQKPHSVNVNAGLRFKF